MALGQCQMFWSLRIFRDFMTYTFTKMHGLGNDFVILDGRSSPISLSQEQRKQLADRRQGIGCDQLILLEPPKDTKADVYMRIFNADGGEVEACGNATRCVGSLLASCEYQGESYILQTVAGFLETFQSVENTSVKMGSPQLTAETIGLSQNVEPLFLPVDVAGLERPVGVGMGNPHMIFFVEDADKVPLARLGETLSKHPLYPKGTNVEFVSCLSRQHLRMRVWERGTGVTPACATGACASVVAGVCRGLLGQGEPVRVTLDGGDLTVTYDGEAVVMSGPVQLAFTGRFDDSLFSTSGRPKFLHSVAGK